MLKSEIVNQLIGTSKIAVKSAGIGYAPSNIALAKYWGKRDHSLNLPMNSSLSISLGNKGAHAHIQADAEKHITLNDQTIALHSDHGKRLADYLDLFFTNGYRLSLTLNIPVAAGLASSACIFAAIVLAMNDLYQWQLSTQSLSILARLGSGSAARSLQQGFVEWYKGKASDGMDSFGEALDETWPELGVGLCMVSQAAKQVSSRDAMKRTLETSPLYAAWPTYSDQTVDILKQAIQKKDFTLLGQTAEQNALSMHATMLSAWPPICYSLPATMEFMQQIWRCRAQGMSVYFTQDAGPNLKLLLLEKESAAITEQLPSIKIIFPFKEA